MNIFITGGASGIGYNLTLKLIKNGYFVFLGVHTNKEVRTTLDKIGDIEYKDRVSVIKFDVTSKSDIKMLSKLNIDCLVNLAGVGIGGSLINMEVVDIKKNFEVNFFGPLRVVKEYIKSRGNFSGKVIFVSSIAGIMPIPFLGSYCASKASIDIFARALYLELKKTNKKILVKLVVPGAYKTGFNQYMIENKEHLDFGDFIEDKESIIESQKKMFSYIEKRSLDSVVNKIYSAIVSNSSKHVYRVPFFQSVVSKFYMLLFK